VGQTKDRRQWHRLALAVPMFVRGTDEEGRSFTELAVAINISCGGALVALRHPVTMPGSLSLEVPRPPIPDLSKLTSSAVNSIDAEIVRNERRNGSQLLGLRFANPLSVESVMPI